MGKKPVIKLRTYRGTEINYDANKNIKNENNIVSLFYGDRGWVLFMKNLPLNGLCKVVVEKGFNELPDGNYEEIKDLTAYQKEVDASFNTIKEVELTEADKKIAELESKIESLLNKDKKVEKIKVVEPKIIEAETDIIDKSKLQEEYQVLAGKKPFHGWSEDVLKEKIETLKNL